MDNKLERKKFLRGSFALLCAVMCAAILLGCTVPQGEIPTGDIFIIWPSNYDGTFSDVETDDPVERRISRMGRNLDELLELCGMAGIEFGVDIPENDFEYIARW